MATEQHLEEHLEVGPRMDPLSRRTATRPLRTSLGASECEGETVENEMTSGTVLFRVSSRAPREQARLPKVDVVSRVKAVVEGLSEHALSLACRLPHDKVRIDVPAALVPRRSRRYGAPVWVSTQTSDGIRRILIEERLDLEPLEAADDLEDLKAWANLGE